eukprot:357615_1
MDFNIYMLNGRNCFGLSTENIDIQKCDYLNRLVLGLNYYTLLKVAKDPTKDDIFIEFCSNTYTQIVSDYTHVISTHEPQLELIHDIVIKNSHFGDCNAKDCVLFKRYYDNSRRRSKDEKKK